MPAKSRLHPRSPMTAVNVAGPSAHRPCLVLIPGTLCDARVFKGQARELRQVAQVLALSWRDLLGGGGPSKVADPFNRLLDRLPPRFAVAGFSLGGLWALQLLARAPDRIERLALIASNAEAGGPRGQRKNARLWRLWTARGPAAVARQCKPAYFHQRLKQLRCKELVHQMAVATPPRLARAQFKWAGQRPDGLQILKETAPSTLLVSGARDRLCPRPLQQRIVAALPSTQWTELPRCGHFLTWEAPSRLTSLLKSWLAEPSPISLENALDHT